MIKMRQVLAVVGLVMALGLLVGTGQREAAGQAAGRRVIYPLMMVGKMENRGSAVNTESPVLEHWVWPWMGYGRPTQYQVSDAALRAEMQNFWWYDWGPECADSKQIPMVWKDVSPELWRCNDGRPLLLLNEPDYRGQADLTPAQAADRLHQVVEAGWKGEIWCCGTAAHHVAYADAIVDSFTARYGPWRATGWAIHLYSNQAVWARDLDDGQKYVPLALADLDTFIAHMRARGVLGRGAVLSEVGTLSAWWPKANAWHSPAQLANSLTLYAQGLQKRKDVLTWAWFSSYYEPLSASDLVWKDGQLTELGQTWRKWMIRR